MSGRDAPGRCGGIHRQGVPRDLAQRLEPRREAGPVVAAKVAVRRARGNDEVVIGQRAAVLQQHAVRGCINVARLAQQRGHIGLLAEQVADGRGNRRRRQAGRGHLVEQGLEQVVVGLVQQRHIHVSTPEHARGLQPAKAATDDDDLRARAVGLRCGKRGQGTHVHLTQGRVDAVQQLPQRRALGDGLVPAEHVVQLGGFARSEQRCKVDQRNVPGDVVL
jgi:hypothetical protein